MIHTENAKIIMRCERLLHRPEIQHSAEAMLILYAAEELAVMRMLSDMNVCMVDAHLPAIAHQRYSDARIFQRDLA